MRRKKAKNPEPSPAEWLVLRAVWDLTVDEPEVTVSEVLPRLVEKRGWHVSTLKSTLERLVQKGYLSHRVRGKTSFYKPEVPRQETTIEGLQKEMAELQGKLIEQRTQLEQYLGALTVQ